jgi:hypothetical protein
MRLQPSAQPYVALIAQEFKAVCQASGLSPFVVFSDFAGMLEASLTLLPANMKATALTGHFIDDPPEVQAIFARARERYLQATRRYPAAYRHMQTAFATMFAALIESSEPGLAFYGQQTELNPDVIGQAFLACVEPGLNWSRYFSDWPEALARARAAIPAGDELILSRLATATFRAGAAGAAVPDLRPGENWEVWIAAIEPYLDPLAMGPPLINTSAMALAAAAQCPPWIVARGWLRFVWEPADPLLHRLGRINEMLYGLNGYFMQHVEAVVEIEQNESQPGQRPTAPPITAPLEAEVTHQPAPPPISFQELARTMAQDRTDHSKNRP